MAYSYTFQALDMATGNPLNGVRITHNPKICDGQFAQVNPDDGCDTVELVSSITDAYGRTTFSLKGTAKVKHYFYAQYPGSLSQVVTNPTPLPAGGYWMEFTI